MSEIFLHATLSSFHVPLRDINVPFMTMFFSNVGLDYSPVLPKSRHTLKMMVSGLFVEFEITVHHIYDMILNTVTMRT